MKAALNYNEKKVQKGQAECLLAKRFLAEAGELNFYQKLRVFEERNRLKEFVKSNTIHISLNFDPTEKLERDKLEKIANTYMQKLGFGAQPYLVYEHHDAGHPHVHILSTTITESGSRINTHNIGRNQSEKARKEIEENFKLVKAEQRTQKIAGIASADIGKAIYGKDETRRKISNIVGEVFSKYKYNSLAEYNAALQQYNVIADRGREEGRIYKYGGLVYRLLDGEGNKIGVPIKASLLSGKQTLKALETKFVENSKSQQEKSSTRALIEAALQNTDGSLSSLEQDLKASQVVTIIRRNPTGRIFGITFIDNNNKFVFNGSELGKGYSIAGIQARLNKPTKKEEGVEPKPSAERVKPVEALTTSPLKSQKFFKNQPKAKDLADILFTDKDQQVFLPGTLMKKKKRKRKNQS